jgi:hypothetical protein
MTRQIPGRQFEKFTWCCGPVVRQNYGLSKIVADRLCALAGLRPGKSSRAHAPSALGPCLRPSLKRVQPATSAARTPTRRRTKVCEPEIILLGATRRIETATFQKWGAQLPNTSADRLQIVALGG